MSLIGNWSTEDSSGVASIGHTEGMARSEGNPQSEWDGHAQWWQREFTDGVDPEYTEQIIPIVMKYLAGRERVLDVGSGEGQIARALAQVRCRSRRARSDDGADSHGT